MQTIVIKEWQELVGKTIASVDEHNSYMKEAIIHFTDGSVVVFDSQSDYESGYHNNIAIVEPIKDVQVRAGIITEEDYIQQCKEEARQDAINTVEWLKANYPELLKQ